MAKDEKDPAGKGKKPKDLIARAQRAAAEARALAAETNAALAEARNERSLSEIELRLTVVDAQLIHAVEPLLLRFTDLMERYRSERLSSSILPLIYQLAETAPRTEDQLKEKWVRCRDAVGTVVDYILSDESGIDTAQKNIVRTELADFKKALEQKLEIRDATKGQERK